MDLKKVGLFGDSPPHLPGEDIFFFPSQQSRTVWNGLTFATPPLSPVDTAINDKEIIAHLSSHSNELRPVREQPEELFSSPNARDISCGRAESPAILNDIMWNAGQRTKRPDSAMDIDVRFNLNATPTAFEQPIANTFVDSDDLLSFSLFESCVKSDSQEDDSDVSRNEGSIASSPFQDLSDSDEEIDVVSVQTVSKHEKHKTMQARFVPTNTPEDCSGSETVEDTRLKPWLPLQRTREKKEDISSTSDSDCETTRISHNDLERRRRNELRNRFNCLRVNIPSLKHNEKAAKITILRKADELITVLEKEEKTIIAEKDCERQRNAELLRKLIKLTKASKRS